MMIGFSKHQDLPQPRVPLDYALSRTVQKSGNPDPVLRHPAPELLAGDPCRLLAAFELLQSKTRVICFTLSFAEDDINVVDFNRGDPVLRRNVASVVELILAFARAGIPERHCLPYVVGTHCHLGRLELNFILPRGALNAFGLARNYNPCPPTAAGRAAWDALRDFLNFTFDWADPLDPKRRQIVSGPRWLEVEVAAADRSSVIFTKDKPPHLLLQTLRRVSRNGGDEKALRRWRDKVLKSTNWTILRETPSGCKVGPDDRSSGVILLLRGAAFSNRPAPNLEKQRLHRETLLTNSRERLLNCWTKLADENRRTLGKGGWPPTDPVAELDAILTSPRLRLPSHHPDFSAPVRSVSTYRTRWTTVADTMQALLRQMFERLEAQFLYHRFARLCAALTPRLKRLATILENRNADRYAEGFGGTHRAAGHRAGLAGNAAEGARDLAPYPSHRRNDAGSRPDRGRPRNFDTERTGFDAHCRADGSGRDADGGVDADRRRNPGLADRPGRDSRAERLSAAKRAASKVLVDMPISVQISRDEFQSELVSLHIPDAVISIDSNALYLSQGALDADYLGRLADQLGLHYEWWRNADQSLDDASDDDYDMQSP
jgi:hypothetical protein